MKDDMNNYFEGSLDIEDLGFVGGSSIQDEKLDRVEPSVNLVTAVLGTQDSENSVYACSPMEQEMIRDLSRQYEKALITTNTLIQEILDSEAYRYTDGAFISGLVHDKSCRVLEVSLNILNNIYSTLKNITLGSCARNT